MRRMSAPARLFESSSREQSTRTIVRSVYQSTALNKAVKLSEALVPCQTSASFRVGLGALNFGASAMGTRRFQRAGLGNGVLIQNQTFRSRLACVERFSLAIVRIRP